MSADRVSRFKTTLYNISNWCAQGEVWAIEWWRCRSAKQAHLALVWLTRWIKWQKHLYWDYEHPQNTLKPATGAPVALQGLLGLWWVVVGSYCTCTGSYWTWAICRRNLYVCTWAFCGRIVSHKPKIIDPFLPKIIDPWLSTKTFFSQHVEVQ